MTQHLGGFGGDGWVVVMLYTAGVRELRRGRSLTGGCPQAFSGFSDEPRTWKHAGGWSLPAPIQVRRHEKKSF